MLLRHNPEYLSQRLSRDKSKPFIRFELAIAAASKNFPPEYDPRLLGSTAWSERLLGADKERSGLISAVPSDVREVYGNPLILALQDTSGYETTAFGKLSLRDRLLGLKPEGVIIHRYGQFNSYGTYDMFLISFNGRAQRIVFADDGTCLVKGMTFVIDETKPPSDSVRDFVRSIVQGIVLESPYASFFMHVLGTNIEIGLFEQYIPFPENYLTVASSIEHGLPVPNDQIQNVQALLAMDSQPMGSVQELYGLLNKYPKEKDPTAYFLFANGEFLALNNRRGIRGSIVRVLSHSPDASILVYKYGSPIDFSLAGTILHGQQGEFIQRSSYRVRDSDPQN